MAFAAAEPLTADQANDVLNPPCTIADRVAVQPIVNNTGTPMSFDTERADTDAQFAPTSTTVTLAQNALYLVAGGATWAPNATGVRILAIQQNGADVPGAIAEQVALTGGASTFQNVSQLVVGTAGDVVRLNTFQTSGGDLNVTGRIGVVRVSGT